MESSLHSLFFSNMKGNKLVKDNILCHGLWQFVGTSNGCMRKVFWEKRVLTISIATTRLLKVDCWWAMFYIWSPLFLKPCLPKHQLHLSAAVQIIANAVIWTDSIILSHSSLTWKREFLTRVALQKLRSKLSVQFHFKMLWGRKMWWKGSWWN